MLGLVIVLIYIYAKIKRIYIRQAILEFVGPGKMQP